MATAQPVTKPGGGHHRQRQRPQPGAAPGRQERAQLAAALADHLIGRADLTLHPGVQPADATRLVARALFQQPAPDTRHGQLLVAALIPRPGPRPPAERAVRALVRTGKTPTPRAVAGELRQHTEASQALDARTARLRPLVDTEGPAAAAAVVDLHRQRGKAPSRTLLGQRLGWPPRDTWMLARLLVEAGWLALDRGRLVPGPGPVVPARHPGRSGVNATPAVARTGGHRGAQAARNTRSGFR